MKHTHTHLHHQNPEISGENFLEKRRICNAETPDFSDQLIGKIDAKNANKETPEYNIQTANKQLVDLLNKYPKHKETIQKKIIEELNNPDAYSEDMKGSDKTQQNTFSYSELQNLINFTEDYIESRVTNASQSSKGEAKPEKRSSNSLKESKQPSKLDITKVKKDHYQTAKEKYNNKEKRSENNWRQINVRIAKELGFDLKGKSEAEKIVFGKKFQKAIGHKDSIYENGGIDGKIGPLTLKTFLSMDEEEKADVKNKLTGVTDDFEKAYNSTIKANADALHPKDIAQSVMDSINSEKTNIGPTVANAKKAAKKNPQVKEKKVINNSQKTFNLIQKLTTEFIKKEKITAGNDPFDSDWKSGIDFDYDGNMYDNKEFPDAISLINKLSDGNKQNVINTLNKWWNKHYSTEKNTKK